MPLVDTEQLTAMAAGAPELLLPILDDFHTDAQSALRSLGEAVSQGGIGEAAGCLHQLKGASGTLGLHRFHELCARSEAEAKQGDILRPSLPGELHDLLEASVQAARTFLVSG